MNNLRPVKKQIKEMQFSLLSPEQIKKLSVAKIVTPELYDVDGYPVDGGLMDLRLGAVDPGVRCRTCGGRLKECLGHPGIIELARPVVHIKYLPIIDLVLRSTCEACGKVLIKDEKDLSKDLVSRIKKAKDFIKLTMKANNISRMAKKLGLINKISYPSNQNIVLNPIDKPANEVKIEKREQIIFINQPSKTLKTLKITENKKKEKKRIEPFSIPAFSLENNKIKPLESKLASFFQKAELNLFLKNKKIYHINQKPWAALARRPTVRNWEPLLNEIRTYFKIGK